MQLNRATNFRRNKMSELQASMQAYEDEIDLRELFMAIR
jgi:hypothetical protein